MSDTYKALRDLYDACHWVPFNPDALPVDQQIALWDQAKAALELTNCEPKASGWRDIESAPRDGTPRLTKRQAAILSAFTGRLLGNFEWMVAYAEEKLGRGLMTHHFADKTITKALKEAAFKDVIAMLPEGTRNIPATKTGEQE